MLAWNNRDAIIANMLNPAYCGLIIATVIQGYKDSCGKDMPYSLIVLILPFMLHKQTMNILPTTSKAHLFTWLRENEQLCISFADRVRYMMPYTKEGLLFMLCHGKLVITEEGDWCINDVKLIKQAKKIEELTTIVRQALILGKMIGDAKDIALIYQSLKIRP